MAARAALGLIAAEADRRELGPGERPAAQSARGDGAGAVRLPCPVASLSNKSRLVQPAQKDPQLALGDGPRRKLPGELARHLSEAHLVPRSISNSACSSAEKWKCSSVSGSVTTQVDAPAMATGVSRQVGPQPQGEAGDRWRRAAWSWGIWHLSFVNAIGQFGNHPMTIDEFAMTNLTSDCSSLTTRQSPSAPVGPGGGGRRGCRSRPKRGPGR